MSREGFGLLRFVSSDDGTRCAAECPHVVRAVGQGDCDECAAFTDILSFSNGANVRHPACIAAEQAAASVPSCEGAKHADVLARVAARHARSLAHILEVVPGSEECMVDFAAEVAAMEWAAKVAQSADVADHLDGGARAQDASEALREARVQGMREAMDIVRVNMHIDTACADILRAIEAVRKGER